MNRACTSTSKRAEKRGFVAGRCISWDEQAPLVGFRVDTRHNTLHELLVQITDCEDCSKVVRMRVRVGLWSGVD